MVNREILSSKLTEIQDHIARVKAHRPSRPEEFAANRDQQDLVAFNLMLAVQACADIASHIIADERWPVAKSLSEGFARLEERGVLSRPVAEALQQAVGLRNVVAHGYAGVEHASLFAAASRGVDDLERFAQEVSRWVLSQPSI